MSQIDTHLPDYQSYMLRFWREGAHAPWRASLQSTADGQLLLFSTLEALIDFLNGQLDDKSVPNAATLSSRLEL